ncbi:MAG: endonuclease domain-containing protein [Alloprevotella sp.]|nr:endonuclease domain-containing protein [Alloprevotella sp.]
MGFGYETAAPDRYGLLKGFAKGNRRNMTESEAILWQELRNIGCGFKFRRQHPIGDYIVDFVCLSKRLVIEVDGGYHEAPEQQREDALRTQFLESRGYSVIRFRNEEISRNLKTVVGEIKRGLFS